MHSPRHCTHNIILTVLLAITVTRPPAHRELLFSFSCRSWWYPAQHPAWNELAAIAAACFVVGLPDSLSSFEQGVFANGARRLSTRQVYVKNPGTLRTVSCVDTIVTGKAGALQGSKQELRCLVLRSGSTVLPDKVAAICSSEESRDHARPSAFQMFVQLVDGSGDADQKRSARRERAAPPAEAASFDVSDRSLHDLIMAWCLSVDRSFLLAGSAAAVSTTANDRAFFEALQSGSPDTHSVASPGAGAAGGHMSESWPGKAVARAPLLLDMLDWADRYELVAELSFDPAHKYCARVLAAARSRQGRGGRKSVVLLVAGASDVLLPRCAASPSDEDGDGIGSAAAAATATSGRRRKNARTARGASTAAHPFRGK